MRAISIAIKTVATSVPIWLVAKVIDSYQRSLVGLEPRKEIWYNLGTFLFAFCGSLFAFYMKSRRSICEAHLDKLALLKFMKNPFSLKSFLFSIVIVVTYKVSFLVIFLVTSGKSTWVFRSWLSWQRLLWEVPVLFILSYLAFILLVYKKDIKLENEKMRGQSSSN